MKKVKNALILAGGDGTRFWPLQDKALYSFLGEPLLVYQVRELSKYAEKVSVVISKELAVTAKRLLDNSGFRSVQTIVQREGINNQAGAILSCRNFVKGDVVIFNANDILDFGFMDKFMAKVGSGTEMMLTGKKMNEYFPGGYFRFGKDGRLIEVVEKPPRDSLPSDTTRMVVDYFSDMDRLIARIDSVKSDKDDHYEIALNDILKSGGGSGYVNYEGYWNSLKYPWHVLAVMKWFLTSNLADYRDKTSFVSENAVITGKVHLGPGVRVGDYVKIAGPAYIGENTVIGDHSLLRECQVGSDCLIGSYTELTRSMVGNKVFLHRNYVGDSVLYDGVMMGAQAVTANLRFDGGGVTSVVAGKKTETALPKLGLIAGKNAKIGVNCTVLPGTKIGRGTWISSGETVSGDIPDGKFQSSGVIRENSALAK